jgi:hypothetical protein
MFAPLHLMRERWIEASERRNPGRNLKRPAATALDPAK